MKITRHKKVHRYISFFCNNYGFRQPYQVLIDGTFTYSALQNKVNIRDQLPKYLDGEVKLLTTQCAILETEKLGPALYGALVIVKQFAVHKCRHEGKPLPASQCLQEMIGVKNASRYILASQDRELHVQARRIPGVPLLYLHQQAPTLERPSPTSTRMAGLSTKEKFRVSKEQQEALQVERKRLGVLEETEEPRKKRKKKGGPNPLSCKKRKKRPAPAAAPAPAPGGEGKRKRRRPKLAQHVREALASAGTQ